MASTDEILDAWQAVEDALDKACPEERDSDKQIDSLKGRLGSREIDMAHYLRRQRNGMIHRRIRIRDSDAFVSESRKLVRLIAGGPNSMVGSRTPCRSDMTPRWSDIAGMLIVGLAILAQVLDVANPQIHAAFGHLVDQILPAAMVAGIVCVVLFRLLR